MTKITDLSDDEKARIFNIVGSMGIKNIDKDTTLLEFLDRAYFWSVDVRKQAQIAINRLSEITDA